MSVWSGCKFFCSLCELMFTVCAVTMGCQHCWANGFFGSLSYLTNKYACLHTKCHWIIYWFDLDPHDIEISIELSSTWALNTGKFLPNIWLYVRNYWTRIGSHIIVVYRTSHCWWSWVIVENVVNMLLYGISCEKY